MKRFFASVFVVFVLLSLIAVPILAQGAPSVELHGYMQNRFYAPPSASARFVLDRVSLSAVAHLPSDTTGYVEVYFHPWLTDAVVPDALNPNPPVPGSGLTTAEQGRTYVESAYLDRPLGAGRIRIGKGRQLNFGLTPSYPNRKTSQYGILAETFTQDRIVGAQYNYKQSTWDIGASLYTDLTVASRKIGEMAAAISQPVATVSHFADRDVTGDISGKLAGSVKLGMTSGRWQGHVSGAVGALTPADAALVGRQYPSFTTTAVNTNTDHSKWGLDATYTMGPFVAQGEWYQGKFSFVEQTGYSALVGYQPKDKDRVYVRYAAINSNQSVVASQLSWPVEQLTVGIVHPISKGVWAELDYEKNMERQPTGVADVKNDLLFLEFFTGF